MKWLKNAWYVAGFAHELDGADMAGACVEAPGQAVPPAAACVRTFPLVARHGLLWIWLGERELAREDLIPDIHWNDDPAWTCSRGYHFLEADFRLAVDNLLEPRSRGAEEPSFALRPRLMVGDSPPATGT